MEIILIIIILETVMDELAVHNFHLIQIFNNNNKLKIINKNYQKTDIHFNKIV